MGPVDDASRCQNLYLRKKPWGGRIWEDNIKVTKDNKNKMWSSPGIMCGHR